MNTADRRRRLPPSSAFDLVFDAAPAVSPAEAGDAQCKPREDRLRIQLSSTPTAIGSCVLQNAGSKVSVQVYGPRPSFTREFNAQATLNINLDCVPFLALDNVVASSTVLASCQTAFNNLILLQQYPKSNIDIFIQVLNLDQGVDDIELLWLIHNATNLALVDSGIALKNTPACGKFQNTNTKVLVNAIHSSDYNNDTVDNTDNELVLTFYCAKNSTLEDVSHGLQEALKDARNLRSEFSSYLLDSL